MLRVTWIDDCLVLGPTAEVKKARAQLIHQFNCNVTGNMSKYVGCKLDRSKGALTFTQPVLLQSFWDKFDLPEEINKPKIDAG